jgi:hypothetical protein
MLVTGVLCAFFGVAIVAGEVRRVSVSRRKFDFLFFFNVWFVLCYCMVPFVLAVGGPRYGNPVFALKYSTSESPLALLSIFLGYGAFVLGYRTAVPDRVTGGLHFRWRPSPQSGRVLWVGMVGVGLLASAVFITRYGGLDFVLKNISGIRTGGSGGGVERDTLGAAINLLSNLIYYAAWIVFTAVVLLRERRSRVPGYLYSTLAVMTVVVVVHSVVAGGRGGMLITFVMYYVIFAFVRERYYARYVALILPLAFVVLLFGKSVIVSTFFTGWDQLWAGIVQQSRGVTLQSMVMGFTSNFTHPYLSLRVAIDVVGDRIQPNWFSDVPLGVYFYARLAGVETPVTVTYWNTYFTRGFLESDVPPGLLGAFWYSAYVPGVVVGSYFFGMLGRALDQVLRRAVAAQPLLLGVYLHTAFVYGNYIFTGDLRVFIIQNVALFAVLFTVFLFLMETRLGLRRQPRAVRAAGAGRHAGTAPAAAFPRARRW